MQTAWQVSNVVLSVACSLPVSTFHSLTVRSQLAVASVLPSGEKARLRTALLCPVSLARSLPVATSHRRAVLSQLAVASVLPSGEKASVKTSCSWPSSEAVSLPVVRSHSLTSAGCSWLL